MSEPHSGRVEHRDAVLAIDIGGTKIAAALVAEDGTVLRQGKAPTLAVVDGRPRSADELFGSVTDALAPLGELPPGLDVGVSSAGPVDIARGTISPLNVPGWREFPVVERLREVLSPARVTLVGDGHCVALGEQWLGAGRGCETMAGAIVSTGVGGGVVVDGLPYQGLTGNAVHVGHVVVHADGEPCACGARGCVEAYASGPSMVRRAAALGCEYADAVALTAAARAGERTAVRVVDEGMGALAAGLASLAVVFDVPLVVIGGGVAKAGAVILDPLQHHFREYLGLPYVRDTRLRVAELDNASLLGAARVAHLARAGRAVRSQWVA